MKIFSWEGWVVVKKDHIFKKYPHSSVLNKRGRENDMLKGVLKF